MNLDEEWKKTQRLPIRRRQYPWLPEWVSVETAWSRRGRDGKLMLDTGSITSQSASWLISVCAPNIDQILQNVVISAYGPLCYSPDFVYLTYYCFLPLSLLTLFPDLLFQCIYTAKHGSTLELLALAWLLLDDNQPLDSKWRGKKCMPSAISMWRSRNVRSCCKKHSFRPSYKFQICAQSLSRRIPECGTQSWLYENILFVCSTTGNTFLHTTHRMMHDPDRQRLHANIYQLLCRKRILPAMDQLKVVVSFPFFACFCPFCIFF